MGVCFCTGNCKNCPAKGYNIFDQIPGLQPVDPATLPEMPEREYPKGGFIPPYEPMASAWQCPKCNSVYGPAAHECWRCNGAVKITCSTNE